LILFNVLVASTYLQTSLLALVARLAHFQLQAHRIVLCALEVTIQPLNLPAASHVQVAHFQELDLLSALYALGDNIRLRQHLNV
jgi:hypothetical protein